MYGVCRLTHLVRIHASTYNVQKTKMGGTAVRHVTCKSVVCHLTHLVRIHASNYNVHKSKVDGGHSRDACYV